MEPCKVWPGEVPHLLHGSSQPFDQEHDGYRVEEIHRALSDEFQAFLVHVLATSQGISCLYLQCNIGIGILLWNTMKIVHSISQCL